MLQMVQDEPALSTAATVSDEALLAVLYIAVNYKVAGRVVRDSSPFTPPGLGIHHVDIFGTGEFHPLHWEALKDLIHGRGGLETIQMTTLPWLVTMADLFHAFGCLEKPAYPLLDSTGKPIVYSPPWHALGLPQPRRPLDSGFAQLGLLVPPVHQSIIDTFQDIAAYSHCLDLLSQRESCSLDELGDCRDIIHHRLMNLPDDEVLCESIMELSGAPKPPFEAQHRTRFTYLFLRSAVLLYIIHVTFPLPRPSLLRQRLLGELASHFAKLGGDFPRQVPVELYLWPAVIAAIAARDEPCRALFVGIIRRLCCLRMIVTYDEFLATMRSFAWVSCACEKGACGLWDEVRFSG
jgi:DNA-directed RNA polymerase subunit N (RpoN/RPB10)